MQVVIPMSGTGQRFLAAGYKEPKPLLDVAGQPVIRRLLEKFPKDWRCVFVCNREHLETTPLRKVLLECRPKAEIVPIEPHKRGPVYAALKASDKILDDPPTFVNYCDFSFVWDPEHFSEFAERTRCDGAVFCYRGFHPHYLGDTLYAYCREKGGRILEIREKEHFTDDRTREYASSGTYFFGSGAIAKKYLQATVDQNLNVKGEHYASLTYNPMIEDGLKVLVYEIPFFLQWGTPRDLEDYVYWHRAFENFGRRKPPDRSGLPRLVMPMAGMGKRFAGHDLPKPLIPVLGMPMFLAAREHLPAGSREPVLVLQKSIEGEVDKALPGAKKVVLDGPTEGQAITTEKALSAVAPDEPVLVSSCDHGLLWHGKAWRDALAGDPDLIVVGQRGYPGAGRHPKSFAYILTGKGDRITGVSVKKPVSGKPQDDLVLVGTFYFKSAKLMGELIAELKEKDVRVNNELYLDSVVELAVERGLDCRCFESTAYLNWGAPDALSEFSYWHRYFQGAVS